MCTCISDFNQNFMQKYMCKKIDHFRFNIFFPPLFFPETDGDKKKITTATGGVLNFIVRLLQVRWSIGKYVEAPVQLAHSFSLCWDGSFHMVRARYREKRR
jgi:hypothetical protein